MKKPEKETRLFDKVIIDNTVENINADGVDGYLSLALCLSGTMEFEFNGKHLSFSKGDLMIIHKGKFVGEMYQSDDFSVRVVYVELGFMESCSPQGNYGMKSAIALFINPIIHLSQDQVNICNRDLDSLEYRYLSTDVPFYQEGIRCALQLLLVDVLNFQVRRYEENAITNQYYLIMYKFFEILETGIYRKHREVSYYASEICITSKYLTMVCNNVSGYSASFWIDRYTSLDISRQLRKKELSLGEIVEMFHFSSIQYFCRYVKRNLGMSPSEYRE